MQDSLSFLIQSQDVAGVAQCLQPVGYTISGYLFDKNKIHVSLLPIGIYQNISDVLSCLNIGGVMWQKLCMAEGKHFWKQIPTEMCKEEVLKGSPDYEVKKINLNNIKQGISFELRGSDKFLDVIIEEFYTTQHPRYTVTFDHLKQAIATQNIDILRLLCHAFDKRDIALLQCFHNILIAENNVNLLLEISIFRRAVLWYCEEMEKLPVYYNRISDKMVKKLSYNDKIEEETMFGELLLLLNKDEFINHSAN